MKARFVVDIVVRDMGREREGLAELAAALAMVGRGEVARGEMEADLARAKFTANAEEELRKRVPRFMSSEEYKAIRGELAALRAALGTIGEDAAKAELDRLWAKIFAKVFE